jgi:ligand-binding sensor domain-containing protein
MRAYLVGAGVAVQLAAVPDASALDSHRGIAQYAHTRYESRNGLAHDFVNSLTQTPDGYLWAGSEEGLNRYDGDTFTTFDHRKTEGIPVNVFSALAVDRAGVLWAGTRDHGLIRLVDGEFHAVLWERGAQDAQIGALAFDRDGDLWIGLHDRGVIQLHLGAPGIKLATRDGLPSNDVRTILAARDGALWIGTFKGLARWQAGHITHGPAALDGIAISRIVQDADGDLWCATANGLAHVHGDTVEWVGASKLPTTAVRQVLFDRDGNLWIGTGKGVARMTPDGQIDVLPRPAAMVLALFEDSEGNLWIGTEGGLDRLRDGDVIPFGAGEGATDEPSFCVREDPTGAMWMTSDAGLYRVPPGQTAATKIVGDRGTMFAIYPDPRGDVWFGGRDGSVGRWHDGRFAWIGQRPWERIRVILETRDGLWFGTDDGLFRMRGEPPAELPGEWLAGAESILPGVAVSAIMPDASGAVWLGTGSGLMRWSAGAFVEVPAGGPPNNTSVATIRLDRDGTLWVGTEGAGLWRLRHDRWFAFTTKDGMFDDLVWSILDDGFGKFWMSSNRGIWNVTRRQLEERASGLRPSVEFVLYGEADGMRDRECDGSMDPPGWRSHDGRLWFPTVRGIAVIDPAHLHATTPADALLESVRVDGQPFRLAPSIVLEPGSSRLELAYSAPALRSPERLRFRYRLEGFDRAWNDAGAQRIAQYTNLAPGDYRFIVEAGIDGAWGKAGTIAITLRPQFYQTRWFMVLAIASTVLVIVAVPLLRVRQLRARARELDQRIKDAVSELKVLSGLLPICAWCKKIRDDGGYWSRIEAYLSERTDAQFTHGICPDCDAKLAADESQNRSGARNPHRETKS